MCERSVEAERQSQPESEALHRRRSLKAVSSLLLELAQGEARDLFRAARQQEPLVSTWTALVMAETLLVVKTRMDAAADDRDGDGEDDGDDNCDEHDPLSDSITQQATLTSRARSEAWAPFNRTRMTRSLADSPKPLKPSHEPRLSARQCEFKLRNKFLRRLLEGSRAGGVRL